MIDTQKVLCYPNFNLNDLDGIKHSLLLCDHVSVIAPTMTPRYQVPMTPVDFVNQEPAKITPYGTDVSPGGALDGLLDECRLDDGTSAVELIDDFKIAHSRAAEFKLAMQQDLQDPDIDMWEKRWRARHPNRDYSWYISSPYFTDLLELDINDPEIRATYHLESFQDDHLGELVKTPFRVGMSLGLSEALWAAVDGEYSLFTIDPASAEFLMLRLRRGLSILPDSPQLRQELNIDLKLAKEFASSRFSTWTLGFAAPDLFEKIPHLSLGDVMSLRRKSDVSDALAVFRAGVRKIVTESGLWKAKDFQTFRREAEHITDLILKPAFEALGQKKFDVKQIVTTFDLSSAANKLIQNIPKLFVSGATGASAAGTVALAGGVSVVPAVLFGLACGLTGDMVAEFIKNRRARLEQIHNAEFLTYSAKLRDALN